MKPEEVKKKFAQQAVDAGIIGHCCNPQYEKLRNDPTMEALRDRTVRVDVPFLKKWKDDMNTYKERHKREAAENEHCEGKGLRRGEMHAFVSAEELRRSINEMKAAGFEHLHIDYVEPFDLLDGFEAGDLQEPIAACAVEATYEGHPQGTPPPPQTECTCDIMILMAQGCKCGWLEIEKKAQMQKATDETFLEELKRMM